MTDRTVNQVLAQMDAWANKDAATELISPALIKDWLEVLRPALAHANPRDLSLAGGIRIESAQIGDLEVFPLVSNMPVDQLRDLTMTMEIAVDHEGGGEVRFRYHQVPHTWRLRAVVSMMSALMARVELAIGSRGALDLLRGYIARREG